MPMPEEHEQPGHVAGYIARLIEACGNRVENAAHQLRRHCHAPDTAPEDRGHRCEQHRCAFDGESRIGEPEIIHPRNFGIKAEHLAQR